MRRGWEDVSFAHILFVPYLSPPDVVCLLSTSRDSAKTFDTSEAWKAVIKASYGSAGEGPRGHRSRRERKKKTYWWVLIVFVSVHVGLMLLMMSQELV